MNRGQKKSVCRYFAANGSCYYGNQCQFQHIGPTPQLSPPTPPQRTTGLAPGQMSGLMTEVRKKVVQPGFQAQHMPSLPRHPAVARGKVSTAVGTARPGHPNPGKQLKLPCDPPAPSGPAMQRPGVSRQLKTRAPKPLSTQSQVGFGLSMLEVPPTSTPQRSKYGSGMSQSSYMPEYSAYTQPPAHIAKQQITPGFSTPEMLRQELLQRQAKCLSLPTESTCPPEVDNYHTLCPLEPIDSTHTEQESHWTFGHASTCYRAICSKDGLYYCLRRIHGFRLTSGKAVLEMEKWRKLQHTNLVTLKEMFTTKAFGDNSLVFVYDYHPGAESMQSRHLQHGRRAGLVPEDLLWEYVIQLVLALRVVHSSGLALSCIHSTKILLSGRQSPRLLVNCGGIVDILTFSGPGPAPSPTLQQQKDLVAAGQLLLCVALQSPSAAQPESFHHSLETLAVRYSHDLHHIMQYLLQSGSKGPPHSVVDVLPMVGGRVYTSLERSHNRQDFLEAQLAREVENGRLFRLLAKLGIITERPEFAGDAQWSETGDRYLLKLFRDYLFHQLLPSGAPWVDLAHIVQTLNKLDAGVPENMALHSRDEQSALVVSYADLRNCLESAFSDILHAAHAKADS